jgi:hypothetical protein
MFYFYPIHPRIPIFHYSKARHLARDAWSNMIRRNGQAKNPLIRTGRFPRKQAGKFDELIFY